MTALLPTIDPDGLLEYSVVYTDRSLNHMSKQFQTVMCDLSSLLKGVYHADAVAIVPGGGTYAMEAVARQFIQSQKTLIIRNGFFSFRWSQIIETAALTNDIIVLKAHCIHDGVQAPFAPPPIEQVCATILAEKPALVFAPHVETASGMMLTNEYIQALAQAAHKVNALLVIDCIASGCIWLDMKQLGIDVLISAPQKGWSGTPCAGFVMLSQSALELCNQTQSNSFACDLKKWLHIMQAFEKGGHAYHATMPTDGLKSIREVMREAQKIGFENLKAAQFELGQKARDMLTKYGFVSVAAPGFQAPGVIVSYTNRDDIQNGSAFINKGIQIASGVPLQVGESADFKTFRIGLFGLDKLNHIDRTVALLEATIKDL